MWTRSIKVASNFFRIDVRKTKTSLCGWITWWDVTVSGCRRLKLLTGHLYFKSAASLWLTVSKPDKMCGQEGYFCVGWFPFKSSEMYSTNCILRKEYDSYFSFLLLQTSSQISKVLNFLIKSIRVFFLKSRPNRTIYMLRRPDKYTGPRKLLKYKWLTKN